MTFLPSLGTTAWLMAVIASLCIGFSKAGFSGFGLIAVFLMAEVIPPKESTGAVLPMLLLADLMAIGAYRRHVSWKDLRGLLPTTALGLLAGWGLMGRIPDALFGHFLGWVILSMMILVVWQRLDRRILAGVIHHPVLASLSGFIAGITTMAANAGGPAMSFYLLARNFDKMAFVGTCAWFFFLTNLTKLPLSWSLGLISLRSLTIDLLLLPGIVAGMLLGRFMLGKIPQRPFERLAVAMATASALRLIFS